MLYALLATIQPYNGYLNINKSSCIDDDEVVCEKVISFLNRDILYAVKKKLRTLTLEFMKNSQHSKLAINTEKMMQDDCENFDDNQEITPFKENDKELIEWTLYYHKWQTHQVLRNIFFSKPTLSFTQ